MCKVKYLWGDGASTAVNSTPSTSRRLLYRIPPPLSSHIELYWRIWHRPPILTLFLAHQGVRMFSQETIYPLGCCLSRVFNQFVINLWNHPEISQQASSLCGTSILQKRAINKSVVTWERQGLLFLVAGVCSNHRPCAVEVDKGVIYTYGRSGLAHYHKVVIFLKRSYNCTFKWRCFVLQLLAVDRSQMVLRSMLLGLLSKIDHL